MTGKKAKKGSGKFGIYGSKKSTELKRLQHKETILRYLFINQLLKESYFKDVSVAKDMRSQLDKVLTHRIFGYIIFFVIMLLVFQSIYSWSSYPMDLIDEMFSQFSGWLKDAFHLVP